MSLKRDDVKTLLFLIYLLMFIIISHIVLDPTFFNPERLKLNILGLATWFLSGFALLLMTIMQKYIED